MENEKSVEQTNATQAEEKKKEPVFGPHGKKKVENLFGKNSHP